LSLDDAQVKAILDRERAMSIGRKPPSSPDASVIPGVQAQATSTSEAVVSYYNQVLGVLNGLSFPVEVAARCNGLCVKYYPSEKTMYISEENSAERRKWDDVPPLIQARALPALSALWDSAKKQTVKDAVELEAALSRFRAEGKL